MIKGHTEIQLYKDGKMVQNTHDYNMLTNALAGYFKNYGLLNPTPFGSDVYNDFITTLLGGVLLLDSAITEQASIIHVPGGVMMTGHGAYGVSNGSTPGDPTELGSFNAAQSGWADNNKTQFRMIWDFTTEQSNATIAYACLTSRTHGFIGEGNGTSKVRRVDGNYIKQTYGQLYPIASNHRTFAVDSNFQYMIGNIDSDNEIKIYRKRIATSAVDMRTTQSDNETDPWTTIGIASTIPYCDLVFGGEDSTNYYFFGFNNGLIFVTLAKAFTSASAVFYNDSTFPTYGTSYSWNIDGDYIYIIGATDGWKMELSNLSNITPITYDAPIGDASLRYCCDDGGKIRFAGAVYDKSLNRVFICNANGDGIGSTQNKKASFTNGDSLFVDAGINSPWYAPHTSRRNDYIASINNLQTPVTKDNTQTMKVIYTLTFTG
jgi:hypothetical protein